MKELRNDILKINITIPHLPAVRHSPPPPPSDDQICHVFIKNINGGCNEIFFSPAKSINGFYGRQIDNLNRSLFENSLCVNF